MSSILTRLTTFLGVFCLISLASATVAMADSVTFTTPPGSTTGGGPVNASATLTASAGVLTVTLTNLQANPTDVAQLISDIAFTTTGAPTGTLSTSSGQEITVNSNGTATLGATVSTGWLLDSNTGGNFHLSVLGTPTGPSHLIIGPPGPGGLYTNANGSIGGNGPHNPFLNQTATFTFSIPSLNSVSQITSFTFSFGTTPGVNVPGTSVPEPTSMLLLGTGLVGIATGLRRRLTK